MENYLLHKKKNCHGLILEHLFSERHLIILKKDESYLAILAQIPYSLTIPSLEELFLLVDYRKK